MTDRDQLNEMALKAKASHMAQEERVEELTCMLAKAILLLRRGSKIYQYGELYPEQARDHHGKVSEFLSSVKLTV